MARAHLDMVGWQAVHSKTKGVMSLRDGASSALRKDIDDITAADIEVVANTMAFLPQTLQMLLMDAVMEEGSGQEGETRKPARFVTDG